MTNQREREADESAFLVEYAGVKVRTTDSGLIVAETKPDEPDDPYPPGEPSPYL